MPDEPNIPAGENPATANADPAQEPTKPDAGEQKTVLAQEPTKASDAGEQAGGDGKENGDAKGDSEKPAEPVDYSGLQFPDGIDVDEAAFGEFKEIAQTMNDGRGLSPDDAQKVIDLRNKMIEVQIDTWDKKFSEWRGEIDADKDLGGENLQKTTIPNVMRAAEAYGSKEFVELLRNDPIYGNNPHVVRFLNSVGKTLREDSLSRGKAASDNSDDARLRRMYPSNFKNN